MITERKTIKNVPAAKVIENKSTHKELKVTHSLQLKTKIQTAEAKRRKQAKERLVKKTA